MDKKGQITIFIILGVVLLIVLVMLFSLKDGDGNGNIVVTTHGTDINLKEIEEYIRQSMYVSIETSLEKFQEQGVILGTTPNVNNIPIGLEFADILPANLHLYPYEKFTFPPQKKVTLGHVVLEKLCDIRGENKASTSSVKGLACERSLYDFPVSVDTDIQTQLREKIKQDLLAKVTKEELENIVRGVEYKIRGAPEVSVQFGEEEITATVKWDIRGKTEDSEQTIEEVKTTYKTSIPLLYTLAYLALQQEVEDLYFNITADYQQIPCLDFSTTGYCAQNAVIEKMPLTNGFYPIKISTATNDESIQMLIQNRNPIIGDLFQKFAVEGGSTMPPYVVFSDSGSELLLDIINISDPDDTTPTLEVVVDRDCKFHGVDVKVVDKQLLVTLPTLENDDLLCVTGDRSILPGCFADGKIFGTLSDGIPGNELRCSFGIVANDADDIALIDYTFFNFVIENRN